MALHRMAWILLGLFIQYQLLAADKPAEDATLVAADVDHGDGDSKIIQTDATGNVQQDYKDSALSEPPYPFELGDITDVDYEDKRGYGKWKNLKWSQSGGKRNIGRWKNRKWRDMQSYGQVSRNGYGYGHSLSKRFSDDDFESNKNGDFIVPVPYGFRDYYGAGDDFEDIPNNLIDKRHMSRWNLIHRKLANMNSGSKRDDSSPLEEKRMGSRWRIIQNKLNQLHSGRSKRFAGRWKNQNWLLQQAYQNDYSPITNDLQKRFN